MINRFTQKAEGALASALDIARELGHSYVGSEHLLLGLMAQKDSIAARILALRGASEAAIKKSIGDSTGIGSYSNISSEDMTPRLREIIEAAAGEAEHSSIRYVGTEHLLFALLCRRDCAAVRLLERTKVSISELKNDLVAFLGNTPAKQKESAAKPDEQGKKTKKSTLLLYGKDLTELARLGRTDPVLCRDGESERIIRILCRRTKNNPCLIGEPGVGKTAIVEGLAQRIATHSVPPELADKKIITLDISAVIAGAKFRGEFEDRIKAVIEEVRSDPSIILFVDEMHILVGAGAAEGAIDASNILKPALARGELRLIGATTPSEYRAHVQKDTAFERRFQPVRLEEPSESEAISILRGLRKRYEAHHGISISDGAIDAAVRLSARYIHDRFLPDKAIDLIDEAAAKLRLSCASQGYSYELQSIERQTEEAIKNRDFTAAISLSQRQREYKSGNAVALLERPAPSSIALLDTHVAELISEQTGIPVGTLEDNESDRLLRLEELLSNEIVGQDAAISAIASAIRRGRCGICDPHRPIGSFLLLGSTGVGKTELCKVLAKALFAKSESLLRLDMSEYMEKHSVSRLIGSPPGYVGYGEGGILTEAIRRRPYSVILLDEVEKAHPDVMHLFLQILEDGILTDSTGRRVDFSSAVIIMTSNLISSSEGASRPLGFSEAGDARPDIRENKRLTEFFRPELLSRIDEVLLFSPLGRAELCSIARILLKRLCDNAMQSGIELLIDGKVEQLLAERCLAGGKELGARRLRKEIRDSIETPLASLILGGKHSDAIRIGVKDLDISFECE